MERYERLLAILKEIKQLQGVITPMPLVVKAKRKIFELENELTGYTRYEVDAVAELVKERIDGKRIARIIEKVYVEPSYDDYELVEVPDDGFSFLAFLLTHLILKGGAKLDLETIALYTLIKFILDPKKLEYRSKNRVK